MDTLRLQFLGDWEDTRNIRQLVVEGGIETRHLRNPGKTLCWINDSTSGFDGGLVASALNKRRNSDIVPKGCS
jgi:hypothetical protein